jgi:hypothetical protein
LSEMSKTSGGATMTDKEIAEDILSTQKYMSNYFYAPAILECADDKVRSVFQQVHNDTQAEAKEVFNYLNMRGWYKVNQADNQSLNELRNTAEQSRQVIQSLSLPQTQWTGTQYMEGQSGYGPSSLGGSTGQGHGTSQGFGQHQGSGWTGTQFMEGQSGYGPSSLSGGGQGFIPNQGLTGYSGIPQHTQLPSWTRGAATQQPQSGQLQREGQTGMGPSSYAQSSYGGPAYQSFPQQANLPSWTKETESQQTSMVSEQPRYGYGIGTSGYYGVPQQIQLPSWTRGGYVQQPQFGQIQPGSQVGMGPSSFAQSSQPTNPGYYSQVNLPSWAKGTGGMTTGQYGSQQQYFQPSHQQVNLPPWTQGTSGPAQAYGQGSYGMGRDT